MIAALSMGCVAPPDEQLSRSQAEIVNGSDDDADVSVVALSHNGVVSCSATLITDTMAMTAAHCVSPQAPDAVLVGAVPANATTIAVRLTKADPGFDAQTLDHDIALVELASSTGVAPTRAADADAAKALVAGAAVTVVGFGGTGPADTTPRRRRSGGVVVASVAGTSFMANPSPAIPCGGDSGGAVLMQVGGETILIGVVSSGHALCDSTATYTRVDATSITDGSGGGCSTTAAPPSSIWLALVLSWRLRRRRFDLADA